MKGIVKISGRPRLKDPNMLAVWPGVGNVSIIAASYLKRKLEFKKLAEIEPSYFFNPIGVLVRDGIIEEPQFPESHFYYLKSKTGSADLILFIGDDQPVTQGYELANLVLDVGIKFGVKRVYTLAAALTRIHHTETSRVWGVATTRSLTRELKQYELVQGHMLQIAGLNGLLLGVAKERNVDGVCLLGEVPQYATNLQNPMAANAVLEVLKMMLGIEVDMKEMAQMAEETREKMKQVVAEAMGEYINYFTEPIWEQGEEGGEEEEDGEDDE